MSWPGVSRSLENATPRSSGVESHGRIRYGLVGVVGARRVGHRTGWVTSRDGEAPGCQTAEREVLGRTPVGSRGNRIGRRQPKTQTSGSATVDCNLSLGIGMDERDNFGGPSNRTGATDNAGTLTDSTALSREIRG